MGNYCIPCTWTAAVAVPQPPCSSDAAPAVGPPPLPPTAFIHPPPRPPVPRGTCPAGCQSPPSTGCPCRPGLTAVQAGQEAKAVQQYRESQYSQSVFELPCCTLGMVYYEHMFSSCSASAAGFICCFCWCWCCWKWLHQMFSCGRPPAANAPAAAPEEATAAAAASAGQVFIASPGDTILTR
jgi:hypothetical protein